MSGAHKLSMKEGHYCPNVVHENSKACSEKMQKSQCKCKSIVFAEATQKELDQKREREKEEKCGEKERLLREESIREKVTAFIHYHATATSRKMMLVCIYVCMRGMIKDKLAGRTRRGRQHCSECARAPAYL